MLTENHKVFRVAIMGIYHESNTFIERTTGLQDFKNGRWLKGQAIIDEYKDAHHELGGAIEVFTNESIELVPIFYAETTPSGIVEETAYKAMLKEIIDGLKASLPLDACFVVPHGAGVAQNHRDMDGSWLAEVRNLVGNIPVTGTLDAHANVSELMIKSTNALFPYQTNPHVDQRETGKRAARFLLSLLRGEVKAQQFLWQAPLAISIEKQNTFAEPCKSLHEFASRLCGSRQALHINVVLGFPYADVKEMGTSVIIITQSTEINEIKESLHSYFTTHLKEFVGEKEQLRDQLKQVAGKEKPVLFLDMGDNVGGGSDGNSTYLLEQLESTNHKCFIAIFDPAAVSKCRDRKLNESFALSFGSNPVTKQPYNCEVTLAGMYSGKFSEKEPRHGGQVHYDMGDTLILSTPKGNIILLHSKRVPPFSLQQLLSCNINPGEFDIIVAKGVNAPIAAYSPVCPSIVFINSPGSTQADMTGFKYLHRRKPLFPFEMPVAS